MEATDNHVVNQTVLKFTNWCLYDRDEGRGVGEWTGKGTGKYLEAQKTGGYLTDWHIGDRMLEGGEHAECLAKTRL